MTDTITFSVPGIHCEHCARAIRDEVSEIGGVETVDVDLPGKAVTVRGRGLSDGDVREAIAEAGYEVA
ncbi:MAG TPA: heavy-metal-associated domain-containing protein [Gaiella sp.]